MLEGGNQLSLTMTRHWVRAVLMRELTRAQLDLLFTCIVVIVPSAFPVRYASFLHLLFIIFARANI